MLGEYLTWALSDFSGYIAADELYDGRFCILSIVDNHSFKRLFQHPLERWPFEGPGRAARLRGWVFRVLDHNGPSKGHFPTQAEMQQFFSDFRELLQAKT